MSTDANSQDWNLGRYLAAGAEGSVAVSGAVLSYRLAGPPAAGMAVVFENGWSASYPYAVWLEAALAPTHRVLCYDRAGVGGSTRSTPPTAHSLTQQLDALLTAVGVVQPLIVVGHSYGGLIGALHAAQMPARIKALVQIDPTPEFNHPLTDPPMRSLPTVARVMQLCALLGIDRPLFMDAPRELPAEIFRRAKRGRRWLARSLNGAIAEIRLIEDIRRAIEASPRGLQCPRLVISGTHPHAQANWLQKLVLDEERMRNYWDAVYALHQRQAARSDGGRWLRLPYNHISLLTRRAAAEEVARAIIEFARPPSLPVNAA
ncbi:MAG TPA: alpha/beta fold hydrolase [Fontimonas sp.]